MTGQAYDNCDLPPNIATATCIIVTAFPPVHVLIPIADTTLVCLGAAAPEESNDVVQRLVNLTITFYAIAYFVVGIVASGFGEASFATLVFDMDVGRDSSTEKAALITLVTTHVLFSVGVGTYHYKAPRLWDYIFTIAVLHLCLSCLGLFKYCFFYTYPASWVARAMLPM
eukprot:m.117724 g.117724  ORF g.117724 m.117724 type:complete len:170 (-) comp13633_c0_seq9:437-946(-)